MAPHTGDGDDVPVALETGIHSPEDIVGIEDIHVLVHQDDMLQLRERRECQQGRLPLLSLICVDGLAALQHRHIFAPAGTVGIAVDHLARQGLVDHAQDAGLGGDTRHVHVLLAGADAGLHNGVLTMGDRFYL